MKLRIIIIGGVAAAALSLGACNPIVRVHHHHDFHASGPITVLDRLDCPASQGRLTRTAAAADGQSCDYQGPDGESVTLTRVALNGQTAQAAMAPLESALGALVTRRGGDHIVNVTTDDRNGTDQANVDLPGIHIHANGDKANVKVFGVTVNADNDKADVQAGSGAHQATVQADNGGATIRANDVSSGNAEMVFILAGDPATPAGYHAVGYIARGPSAGPLVVAQFRSKFGHHHDHDNRDLEDLIALNARS